MAKPLLLAGKWTPGERDASIKAPWDGREVAQVAQASRAQAEQALAFAHSARLRLQAQTTAKRREVLERIVAGLRARAEELALAICHEAGKPITAARFEVTRAIETFTLAAAELSTFGGRTLPVDTVAATAGLECETRRFPAGVVVGIVPFNFPLNLGAHKVAPALAVGSPIIVKPPPQSPTPLLIVGELALAAGADPAALQVLPCDNPVAEALATDARTRVLSFTGSAKVGWQLKGRAAGKTVLELGGNAAAIVCADADPGHAAKRLAASAFSYAGQVCIKVQRVIVEAPVFDAFMKALAAETGALKVGDPSRDDTVVGPVIDDASAQRIESWVAEAGGSVSRQGRLVEPLVLAEPPRSSRAWREEIFGPVVGVAKAADFDEALILANDSQYGLQASVFTNDLKKVRRAFAVLEVGGVIINDAPSVRSDNQPYGGVKGSGLGREGVRYAMEDFTEERALLTRTS
ncbi:MAG: aldehyde dehydrogenase family protein [Archangiaceae bacterium]|nr:aldehyde dehydrogenase family protein [Archangiaceae bacterium]